MNKLITILCLIAAVALGVAPVSVQSPIRTSIRDGLQPGVRFAAATWRSLAERVEKQLLDDSEKSQVIQISNLKSQLSELSRNLRREQLAHQRTRDEKLLAMKRHDSQHRPIDPPPLIVPQVVEAHVLGEELASVWRGGKLLDRGATNGVLEASLVLDANAKLLDQGQDIGLVADLPIFAGSSVIGKLQHVGRWSSTWVPLTDKRFSGRARLARVTENGLEFGAAGILTGTGKDSCRLLKIRVTEPVSEGDEVFAWETPGGFETPLFYGTVVKAKHTPEATEWEIEVRPSVDPQSVRAVCIVRPTMNLKRLAN